MNEDIGPMPIIVKSQQPHNQAIEMQDRSAVASTAATAATNPFHSKQERGKAFRQVVAAFIANLGTINTVIKLIIKNENLKIETKL